MGFSKRQKLCRNRRTDFEFCDFPFDDRKVLLRGLFWKSVQLGQNPAGCFVFHKFEEKCISILLGQSPDKHFAEIAFRKAVRVNPSSLLKNLFDHLGMIFEPGSGSFFVICEHTTRQNLREVV